HHVALGLTQRVIVDGHRFGPAEHETGGREQGGRYHDGSEGIDMTQRVQADPPERVCSGVAEPFRHIAVRRFVQRDGENDRDRINRDGLYEIFHGASAIARDSNRAVPAGPVAQWAISAMEPLPLRTISTVPPVRSTTVVGSTPHGPASITRSRSRSSRARISVASFSGASSSGRISVVDNSGSLSSASSACATGWSGTRKPMVLRRGCRSRRGNSRVPSRMKV